MREDERATLDSVAHPVFVLEQDADGAPRYVAFNTTACARAGVSEDQVVGMTAIDLYEGRLGEAVYEQHVAAMRDGLTRSYEVSLPVKGEEIRVRTVLTPVFVDDGALRHVVGVSTVIERTIIANADDDRRRSDTEFIRLAAHDLRAPLRRVKSIAGMLRDFADPSTEDGEEIGELLDLLDKVAANAGALIGDVLAHGLAMDAESFAEEFDFGELCRGVLAYLDPQGRCEANIRPARAFGDKTAAQIVLRNLIENALKHGEEGATQRLDLSLRPYRGGFFEISVRDHGVGFSDPAVLFLKSGRLRTDSGYGLLGVRNLVRDRGGSITAANAKDGPGAVVSFTLPGEFIACQAR